jgi:phosphonate transport system substrate-binding protein
MRVDEHSYPMSWLPACGAALLSAILFVQPALAQDEGGGALRFLKPWIEKQLFGRETSGPAAAPAAPAITPAAPPPPSVEAASPDQALPARGAPDPSVLGDDTPPLTPEAGAGLRGTVAPPGDGDNLDAIGSDSPGPSAAPDETLIEPEIATPGVPVEVKPEGLRFAVLAGRSISATMATIGPVADELQTVLGRPVEILPLASYDAMVDAQSQRRIDGGFYSAAAFAAADTACVCLDPLVAPKAADGTLAYHAVIVARAGAGVESIADLAGKTVAIGAADSLGTRRLQLAGLLSDGLDPSTAFGAVLHVDSAEAAVGLVAAGAADAAFAWSSMTGDAESGYSRGTLTGLFAAGRIAMNSLIVIWSSPPVTHGPFAVLRTLPEADKQKIESYLLALSAGNPDAYDMLDPLYGGGYASVDPQDYSGLKALLARDVDALRLPGGPATTGATEIAPAEAMTPIPATPPAAN